jgi:F-type H+-transporting ATPase subunit a
MLIAVGIIALLMIGLTSRRAVVPGRFQALAEVTYEFVATTLQRTGWTRGNEILSSGVLAVHVHSCP